MMKAQNTIWRTALLGVLALGLVACGLPSAAAVSAPQSSEARQLASDGDNGSERASIIVSGTGTATATPDVALIELGVETIDADAGEAIAQSTQQMTAVMNAIKELGIAERDVQTVRYNIWIEQIRDRDGRLTGEMRYHVANQVRVRVRELNKVGTLLEKTLAAGANTVNSISFALADPSVLEREARDKAIADAKTKAQQLADGLGVKVGPARQVSDYSSGPAPIPVAKDAVVMRAAAAEVPISSGEYSISIQIQVTFDLVQ